MKVAVSLPDQVFKAAERLARRQRKPRSRLYAEAIAEYVAAHDESDVTRRLNAVYESESSAVEAPFAHAQLKALNEAW